MKKLIELITANPWLATIITGTVFPAIFAALAATNEMYHAVQTDSDWGKSSQAYEQKSLWETNLPCMQNSKFSYLTNNHNVEIGTMVCPSGDVLISAKRPNDKHPAFKWVSWSNISTVAFNFSLLSEANASTIINSYYSKSGYLVQEIVDDAGYCTRYYINPHNGQVAYSESC